MSNFRQSVDLVEFWEQEVKPRLRFEEVYARVRFTSREGRYRRGHCPLHGGSEDNFSVDTQTLRWTCFSHCGSGSVLAYLNEGSEPRGVQWVESVRKLAHSVGLELPQREISEQQVQQLHATQRRESLLEAFWQLAQRTLQEKENPARAYLLHQRGFSEEEIALFGACPPVEIIRRELLNAHFSSEEIEASGLLRDSRWEGRVLIAWRDHRGSIGTFAAREISDKTAPDSKYLYLSTQNGWARKKSELLLLGLDTALPAARQTGFLLVVEGIFDALRLQMHSLPNVAAIGGGGQELSVARLEKLKEIGVSHLVLLLDNDRKADGSWPGLEGNLAIVRNSSKSENVPVIDIIHPKNLRISKDPDSFVQEHGIEALRALIDERVPAVLFEAGEALRDISPRSSDAERRSAVDSILEIDRRLKGVRAALDREDLLQMATRFTGYSYETLAQLAEDWRARRERELLEKRVDDALRAAQRQRAAHESPLQVLDALSSDIAEARALAIHAPQPFSVERLERESAIVPVGKKSGWEALDKLDVRFNAGELAVVAARTGHGKTSALVSLLLNWLRPLADIPGDEVLLFYSSEEPELRIYHRLLSMLTASTAGGGWTVAQLRDFLRGPYSRGAEYSWPDPRSLHSARDFLRSIESHLHIIYRPAWNIEEIEAHARATYKRRSVGAVLVDYLQRVPPPAGRFDRRDQEVSAIGRRLKSLSVDVAAPVIAGAQINREAIPEGYARTLSEAAYETAKNTIRKARPELHHLREGGSEQEADLILGLLNYAADFRGTCALPPATLLEIGTLKNRYGEAGKWTALAFEGRYGLVREPRSGESL